MNKVGYPKIKLQKISAPVSGMTCASCVARVEKSIGKIEGVSQVSVNLATEKASFTIDDTHVSLSQVEKVVEDAGYNIDFSSLAKDENKTGVKRQSETIDEYYKDLRKDFLNCCNLHTSNFPDKYGNDVGKFSLSFCCIK